MSYHAVSMYHCRPPLRKSPGYGENSPSSIPASEGSSIKSCFETADPRGIHADGEPCNTFAFAPAGDPEVIGS